MLYLTVLIIIPYCVSLMVMFLIGYKDQDYYQTYPMVFTKPKLFNTIMKIMCPTYALGVIIYKVLNTAIY